MTWSELQHITALDGIQDPGNLGTIIRTSDWLGESALILLEGTVDPYNPKVIQSSMGACFFVPIYQMTAHDLVTSILREDILMIGADMYGKSVYDYTWPERSALIIGNEGQGLSQYLKDQVSEFVSIPSSEQTVIESLNAAVSHAVIATMRKGA